MNIIKLLAFATTVACPVIAGATVLVDGSFQGKSSSSSVSDYCYDGIATSGGGACSASAWQGNSGIIKSGSAAWGGTVSVDGGSYAFVQISGVLSQTFTASSTGSFTLNWLDAGRSNQGAAQSYVVALTSNGIVTDLGTFTTEAGQQFVARSSTLFGLTSGTVYSLSFTGLSTVDNTSFIDNVAIAAIPEPATWALLIMGFAMIGVAMRRRKTAAAA